MAYKYVEKWLPSPYNRGIGAGFVRARNLKNVGGSAMLLVSETRGPAEEVDQEKLKAAVRMILEAIGENPDREGLLDTPRRVAEYFAEVTAGLHRDPSQHLDTLFDEGHEEMVIVRDIGFHSICEHHLVPFAGKAHVVYIPGDGRVVGLSKLARVVEDFARRPQVQERLTRQVADAIVNKLSPRGVLVVCEAEHMCMSMRGIKKVGASTVTSAARGVFQADAAARAEAISLLKGMGK
jgi:GTP cyclohydrolase IA